SLAARGGEYRRYGSAALSLALVADGKLDGFIENHLSAWDVAAGIMLVTEAGGWTNDFFAGDGLRRGNPMLAAAPGVRDAVLGIGTAAAEKAPYPPRRAPLHRRLKGSTSFGQPRRAQAFREMRRIGRLLERQLRQQASDREGRAFLQAFRRQRAGAA